MKIILFSHRRSADDAAQIGELFEAIRFFGFDYAVNEEFAVQANEFGGIDIAPEKTYGQSIGEQHGQALMVCYGGDGTLLEGVRRLGGAPIPVMGINAGHLGFLTSAPNRGFRLLFERIAAGALHIEARSMLSATGTFTGAQPDLTLALNEFAIRRNGAGMISIETFVDAQMVATYHGDGVIVSTPTGSTAYSLSAGGPVVAPTCACLVISPLAPHNLTMRPVVIPDTATITLRVNTRHSDAVATLDNRVCAIGPDARFTVKQAREKIFLALPHNISFYDTLRNKMMWGIDVRS